MSIPEKNDRWLDALAGREPADDPATRQAASARAYFEQRQAHEMQATADPQREKRLRNHLAGQGAFSTPQTAAKAAHKPGLATRFMHWLLPTDHLASRRAFAVALVVAAVGVPLLMHNPDTDDDYKEKSLDPRVEQLVLSAHPAVDATRLMARLAQLGVPAEIGRGASGRERVLTAQVPPEQLDTIRQALMAEGLMLPDSGDLQVRLKPSP